MKQALPVDGPHGRDDQDTQKVGKQEEGHSRLQEILEPEAAAAEYKGVGRRGHGRQIGAARRGRNHDQHALGGNPQPLRDLQPMGASRAQAAVLDINCVIKPQNRNSTVMSR